MEQKTCPFNHKGCKTLLKEDTAHTPAARTAPQVNCVEHTTPWDSQMDIQRVYGEECFEKCVFKCALISMKPSALPAHCQIKC